MSGSIRLAVPAVGSRAGPVPAAKPASGVASWRQRRAVQRAVRSLLAAALLALLVLALSVGAYRLSPLEVARVLVGLDGSSPAAQIVLGIRLPQALCAIVAGAILGLAGALMQSVLRNPLASPFTLGVSQAAGFGAAFAVTILGSGQAMSGGALPVTVTSVGTTTVCALAAATVAAVLIVALARLRDASPEVMVLAGVAIGALCTAGTMVLQFFASDVQLAAIVFWTFGDVSRAGPDRVAIMAGVLAALLALGRGRGRVLDALLLGDETARSVGVATERLRLLMMVAASLATAVVTSFLGIIGFVGLLAPHMARRLAGAEHRALLPTTALVGALILLAADSIARVALLPHVLPVSVVTGLVGAPLFLFLVLRGARR